MSQLRPEVRYSVASRHRERSAWRLPAALAIVLVCQGLCTAVFSFEDETPEDRRIAIITHPDNEYTELTRWELGRMFLKRRTTWNRGERVIPIDQSGTSEIRERFYRIVLNRSVYDMKRYWMQETMTGDAKPPVSLENSTTVKKYIEKLKGGIAYIYEDELDETVKAIAIVDIPEFYRPDDDESEEDTGEESLEPEP